jgi:O-antigen/teichoic acid export membrane protein
MSTELPSSGTPSRASGGGAKGAAWTGGARACAQASQFLLLSVAAHYLEPAQFGTFTLISVTALGFSVVAQAGWREYIISQDDERARSDAHAISLLSGLVLAALGLLASFVYYQVTRQSLEALTATLLACWVALVPATTAQSGILTMRGHLSSLGKAQVAAELASLAVGVFALHLGLGVLALAISKLAMQTTALITALVQSRWYSVTRPSRTSADTIFRFARRVLTARVTSFAIMNVSLYAIGGLLGPADAGLYRAGARFAGAVGEVIAEPVRLLAWTRFRDSKDGNVDIAATQRTRLSFLLTTLAVAFPLLLGLAATSETIVRLCLGPRWLAAAPVVSLLAVGRLFTVPSTMTEPVLTLRGRVQLVPRLAFVSFGLVVSGIVVGSMFGLSGVAWGELSAAFVMLPVTIFMQTRVGGLPWRKLVGPGLAVFVCAVAMVVPVRAVGSALAELSPVLVLLAQCAAGTLAYAVALRLLAPQALTTLAAVVSRK